MLKAWALINHANFPLQGEEGEAAWTALPAGPRARAPGIPCARSSRHMLLRTRFPGRGAGGGGATVCYESSVARLSAVHRMRHGVVQGAEHKGPRGPAGLVTTLTAVSLSPIFLWPQLQLQPQAHCSLPCLPLSFSTAARALVLGGQGGQSAQVEPLLQPLSHSKFSSPLDERSGLRVCIGWVTSCQLR